MKRVVGRVGASWIGLSVLWCCLATSAYAASPTLGGAVKEGMTSSGDALAGLRELKERGARVGDVLTIEALPGGSFGAEVELTFKAHTLRYPLKFKQVPVESCDDVAWEATWSPDAAYTSALLNVSTSGALPDYDPDAKLPAWTSLQRLPAMPLVVTQKHIFSPFGKIAWSVLDAEIDPTKPSAEVVPPRELVTHTKLWITTYLEDEQGAASVDIVADGRLTWQQLNRLIFGVSSTGLYKAFLVMDHAEDKTLRSIETAAPVFGSIPGVKKPVPLVLGYYRTAAGHGWRVSQGKALLKEDDTCDAEMSFCTKDVAGFLKRFEAIVTRMRTKNPDNPQYAMFASTKEVALAEALTFLQHAGQALGIPQGRVFIGYIKEITSYEPLQDNIPSH